MRLCFTTISSAYSSTISFRLPRSTLFELSRVLDRRAFQLTKAKPRYGKFIFEAWKHPQTLAIISNIAGVDLVPVIDYEIGHVNISVLQGGPDSPDVQKPVVDWHHDSYPFVCVLMLSDTEDMVGGETALETGTGDIMKVRGPEKVIMNTWPG